jgi:DNA-nicking Smr family endonuclease
MKKKKPIAPKPKEFASTPFSALKGIKPVVTESLAIKVQKPVPVKKAEPDDMDLFLAAMNGVEKFGSINTTKKPLQPPPVTPMKAVARKIEESEQKLFLEAIRSLHLDVRFQDDIQEDAAPAPRPVSRIKQLRRGTIRLDYELDLHGLTREEATHALETFIKGAYRRGQQAVLIITGRGNHSPDEPVLKRSTEKWLKENEGSMIAEFLTAPSQFGGDGATIVFLKKNPELNNPSEGS